MSSNTSQQCHLYHKNNGSSGVIKLANSYGGIPQNLITNVIGLTILIVVFLLLRKAAWKVVNKIVKLEEFEKWTHVFFSHVMPMRISRRRRSDHQQQEPSPMLQDPDSIQPAPDDEPESGRPRLNKQYTQTDAQTFCEWFKSIFATSDEDIELDCGSDALQYIRFQRHVIFYLIFVVVCAIGIALPVNFQGTLQGNTTSFEHTTLVNLDPSSNMLWTHVALSFVFFPLAILIMRRFSVDLKFQDISLEVSRTLMVENVPKVYCTDEHKRDTLLVFFDEAFPNCEVTDLHFAYDVEKAQDLYEDLEAALDAKRYCDEHASHHKPEIELYDVRCSRYCYCFCCCCSTKVVGRDFYKDKVNRLEMEFDAERDNALSNPLGMMFVTFKTVNMAKEVYDAFRKPFFKCHVKPPNSSLSETLDATEWLVTFAPPPSDIRWENLSVTRRCLMLRKIVVNVGLFFVALFLTTPEYLVSQSDFLVEFLGEEFMLPSWLVDFLPTILLWSFTALLPLLVVWSDRFLGHWTRSAENHAIMKKTFWFLLFMVVVLPTLGFTTLDAVLKFIVNENESDAYRWECIFLPDSGAFFVNYIITASLIGAGLELIRFPELLMYLAFVCWSKSEADTPAIRKAIKYEFRFGEQYARILLLFCMTVMFSLSCPLITPFGLLFFITKHYVDRHNLLYAYKPSKINKQVHSTAISYVILSVVVLQFFMVIFLTIRNASAKTVSLMTKVMVGIFLVSVNVFSAQLWSNTCKKLSPIKYTEGMLLRDDIDYNEIHVYLPRILQGDGSTSPFRDNPIKRNFFANHAPSEAPTPEESPSVSEH